MNVVFNVSVSIQLSNQTHQLTTYNAKRFASYEQSYVAQCNNADSIVHIHQCETFDTPNGTNPTGRTGLFINVCVCAHMF